MTKLKEHSREICYHPLSPLTLLSAAAPWTVVYTAKTEGSKAHQHALHSFFPRKLETSEHTLETLTSNNTQRN